MPSSARRCPGCSLGRWPLWLAVAVLAFPGCAPASDHGDAARSASNPSGSSDEAWTAALREPSVEVVLRALAQSHANVREKLGPHRLHYTARFSLADPGNADDSAPRAELDQPSVLDDAVRDDLELMWAPAPDGTPRLRLRQSNDHDRGREVVLVDGHIHSRDLHRPWQFHPVETDLHERWLDEAQRAVHDVLELAAPRLRIDTKATDDGTVTLELGASQDTDDAGRRRGMVSQWRAEAEIERISGDLVLDASSGAWRSANVTVQYALQAADGRMLRGTVQIEGRVEPLPPDRVDIRAPAESEPLPERARLHAERQELLDGLAAPR